MMSIAFPAFRPASRTNPVRFSQNAFGSSPDKKPPSAGLEWIETGGDGSYASSTIGGANTRRQHGLFIHSAQPPVARKVLISRMDETLLVKGEAPQELSSSLFNGQPADSVKTAPPMLDSFSPFPIATWFYNLPNRLGKVQKQLAVRKDHEAIVMGYSLSPEATEPVQIKLKPFLNDRDLNDLTQRSWNWRQSQSGQGLTVTSNRNPIPPEGQSNTALHFQWQSNRSVPPLVSYQPNEHWYWNYSLPREKDRGQESTEHNFTPGELTLTLRPGETISLTISSQPLPPGGLNIAEVGTDRSRTLHELLRITGLPDTQVNRLLVRAADQFIVQKQTGPTTTILPGYPANKDWARDALVALPGLTLTMKRYKDAESVLTSMAAQARNGLLPNRLTENPNEVPGYNNLDATMWWFNAVGAYTRALQGAPMTLAVRRSTFQFLKSQYEALNKVVAHLTYGRLTGQQLLDRNPAFSLIVDNTQGKLPVGERADGIGMEPDGLLALDNPTMTWMDAVAGDRSFTPRSGKPVEINALWYNGLKTLVEVGTFLQTFQKKYNPENVPSERIQELERKFALDIGRNDALARIVKESMQKFWNEDGKYLYDVLETPHNKGKYQVRPNQILAVGLPHRAFHPIQERAILKTVEEQLLTPFGLRSLSPRDAEYAPHYPNAGPAERARALHQGTVWSWMIGPYLDAFLNVHGNSPEARREAQNRLQPLLDHLEGKIPHHVDSGAALGGVAEMFDGDYPHHAKGAVNQARSVAEVLRLQVALSKQY